jgi:hypothetical protein
VNDLVKAATKREIAAVNTAAIRLNLRPLSIEVTDAVAPYGAGALLECTLAAQSGAVGSVLRALLHREALQQGADQITHLREFAPH